MGSGVCGCPLKCHPVCQPFVPIILESLFKIKKNKNKLKDKRLTNGRWDTVSHLPFLLFWVLFEKRPALYFVIINLLLPIKCIIFDCVSKILFIFFLLPIIIIMILIMKILLHNVYKIINLRYPTNVYQFLIYLFIIILESFINIKFFNLFTITKIECWPV